MVALMTTDTSDHAAKFREIADKIDRNAKAFGESDFGGAYVIVAPDGQVFDLLMLADAVAPAMFWASLQTRVKIALDTLDQEERQGGAMAGFRR